MDYFTECTSKCWVQERSTNFKVRFTKQVRNDLQVCSFSATCSFSNNVCAMLCGTTQDARLSQLEKLYDGEDVDFDTTCPQVARMYSTGVDFSRGRTFVTRSTSISATVKIKLALTYLYYRRKKIFECWYMAKYTNFSYTFGFVWSRFCWFGCVEYSC